MFLNLSKKLCEIECSPFRFKEQRVATVLKLFQENRLSVGIQTLYIIFLLTKNNCYEYGHRECLFSGFIAERN
jgi:hypothetical protein